mmetsp:Transcript_5809/g.6926  ORF Transcript_5809/g.6926 Transcript_5809/m.6926 type:complete len:232 (+) Transcript_5809:532-1227(+)|eukprot:CAMPEP_0170473314 /NCGR_PEP_ID=MMETSP0123-20130129/15233_1 /TAXON_ID=182087 /ORGANISM="Favella ehrenbergii, Strain Fehren 1" /LENGTH=231 /DNA_ID=CAMNT_0010742237 /DNA_START=434 /DNA_END=1129 /DNA_ORIENTATION=+
MVVRDSGPSIIDKLLGQYENHDDAHFVGEYLRMYAQYPALLKCWCKMGRIQTLLRVILNFNFNIQSDAVETTIYLLMTERANDIDWANFIEENKVRFIETFSQLYDEITDDDAGDKDDGENKQNAHDDEGGNFFALKELMKLQYQMLTKQDKCFKSMQHYWSNNKQCLIQVMQLMEYEDDSLIYECILQLSLFLRPSCSPEIKKVLTQQSKPLIEAIEQYQPRHPPEDDFI